MTDRVTIVDPDNGREVKVENVDCDGNNTVKIPLHKSPNWERTGIHVVAAKEDGTVTTAFEVTEISHEVTCELVLLFSSDYRVYKGK